jgi:hypothetical protein
MIYEEEDVYAVSFYVVPYGFGVYTIVVFETAIEIPCCKCQIINSVELWFRWLGVRVFTTISAPEG